MEEADCYIRKDWKWLFEHLSIESWSCFPADEMDASISFLPIEDIICLYVGRNWFDRIVDG